VAIRVMCEIAGVIALQYGNLSTHKSRHSVLAWSVAR
jgi:hypothetical protein